MVTSGLDLPGYRIVRNFGIVRGIVVRSRSLIGNLGAALQTIWGGNITLLTNLCERTREDAFELLLQHAGEHGANAVIGMRYDATEVMQGVPKYLLTARPCRWSAFPKALRRILSLMRTGDKLRASHFAPLAAQSSGKREVLLVLRPGDGFGHGSDACGP